MAYPATPKTWVAGDVLTAAQLNAELRDALLAIFPLGPPDVAWTPYTPTLTQSGAVTKTVNQAAYTRVGRKITAHVMMTCTGSGTAANEVRVGLPITARVTTGDRQIVGQGAILDISANVFIGGLAIMKTDGNSVAFVPTSTDSGGFLGQSVFTAALASTDVVSMTVTYESAT
jgi:hypothetical protein